MTSSTKPESSSKRRPTRTYRQRGQTAMKTRGRGSLKVQQKDVCSIGFRVGPIILGNSYLIYTNLSIPAKSPLWKVLSSHISLHYIGYNNISWRPHDPYGPHQKSWESRSPNSSELTHMIIDHNV